MDEIDDLFKQVTQQHNTKTGQTRVGSSTAQHRITSHSKEEHQNKSNQHGTVFKQVKQRKQKQNPV